MKRLPRRLLQHHLPLLIASGGSVLLLYFTRSYADVLSRLSFATAYPALFLLVATLAIGPWDVLRGKLRGGRLPVSSDLRRDVGIWAGILGFVHAVVGQNVHLRGRPWLYYVYEPKHAPTFPVRHDLFGVANYTGLIATLVLLALLATSNDYSLRKLGTPGWKRLQQWNYLIFVLTGVHVLGYQKIETQKQGWVLSVIFGLAIALVMQAVGFFRRRAVAR